MAYMILDLHTNPEYLAEDASACANAFACAAGGRPA
jgi:hypothetical protein